MLGCDRGLSALKVKMHGLKEVIDQKKAMQEKVK